MKKRQKIYICGPITGRPKADVMKDFYEAEGKLKILGYDPVNPLKIVNNFKIDWTHAMEKCIAALFQCQGIALLPGFTESKGCRIEIAIARELKLKVKYIKEL